MRIRRSHHLGLEEAKNRADHIAETIGRQFSLTSSWQGDHLVVRGAGVNGYLLVEEDSLEIEVKLGFALKLMEAPIRSAIENAIDEELASDSAG
jgi:putative polyhydroxyalkanoate system protein